MAIRISLLISAFFFFLALLTDNIYSEAYPIPFGPIRNLKGSKKGQKVNGLHHVKSYLAKFGYLQHTASNSEAKLTEETDEIFDDRLESAIKTYQLNHRLRATGYIDTDTVKQMMKPRCGFPDIINGMNTMHHHRDDKTTSYKSRKSIYGSTLYTFNGGQWPASEKQLTYKYLSKTTVPGTENMAAVVRSALDKWSKVSPFSFKVVSEESEANLVFAFYKGDHGDGEPFDGPGGILGHSFTPPNGNSHYDGEEKWSENPGPEEMDLESVVLHEIGHLLGLAHSDDESAVMYPDIGPGDRKRELQEDDIHGIQAMYGSN